MVNCCPCEETTGKKIKKQEVLIEDDEGDTLMVYVCPECGDVSD